MQVREVRILNVRMLLFQVVSELHGDICPIVTLWAVVHLDTFMFAGV